MQTLVAVSKDLLYFVFAEQFGLQNQRAKSVTEYTEVLQSVASNVESLENSESSTTAVTFTAGEKIFVAIPETPLLLFPTVGVDSVLAELPFGTEVTYCETQGRYIKVATNSQTGWVAADALILDKNFVSPKLTSRTMYDSKHSVTIAIRTHINDEFHTTALDIVLQDIEYVLYRHTIRGILIPWTSERPRIAGTWQRLLKGQPGVHMSITPKTDAIFETIAEDGTGEVAYVDAVYPDQSIKLSRIGAHESGEFSEEVLPLTVWRELRPVFISIT